MTCDFMHVQQGLGSFLPPISVGGEETLAPPGYNKAEKRGEGTCDGGVKCREIKYILEKKKQMNK